MLLAVFGAGASFDSVNPRIHPDMTDQFRPPLADQLFDPRFRGHLQSYRSELGGTINRLRDLPDGTTLEDRLEELTIEGATYPKRFEQLAAVRFYLQRLLWDCSN